MTSTRTSLSTPCPAPSGLDPSHRRISSLELFSDDTTSNIDYTRAFDQPLTSIKPRRRSMMGGGKAKRAPVTTFEDVQENEELVIEKQVTGKTLLGKPAQKLAVGGGIRGAGRQQQSSMGLGRGGGVNSGNDGSNDSRFHMRVEKSTPSEVGGDAKVLIAKKPRRATIYIPEDTTVMTIHPGANNTTRLDDTFHAPVPARRPRQSLSAAPKRLPLRESFSAENMPGWDVAGYNTGKENVPPGAVDQLEKGMKKLGLAEKQNGARRSRPSVAEAIATSRHRASLAPRHPPTPSQVPTLRTHVSYDFRRDRPAGVPSRTVTTEIVYEEPKNQPLAIANKAKSTVSPVARSTALKKPTPPKSIPTRPATERPMIRSFIASKRHEQQVAKVKDYPVLAGDLSQPELYENDWLDHQEIALTEIVNHIFANASPVNQNALHGDALRQKLIEIYNQPETALLHRRIQASLEYGALSPPSDSFSLRNPSLDIGLRKHLINLWIDNYDHDVLRIAAEVVAGRQIPRMADCSTCTYGLGDCTIDPHAERRALINFLELFFVCIGDVTDEGEGPRWRKLMGRGLMLILLLDEAKASGFLGGCLFKPKSPKKSSTAILNAFAAMLLPSVGDIGRSLKHMDYEIVQVQDPLHEQIYRIENLATDLRNGLQLTRLVEILLCSREARDRDTKNIGDTLEIYMPDKTVLLSSLNSLPASAGSVGVLSKHLKFPCLGEAEKKYNIQVALSALESHSTDGINVVGDISCQDILVGHREKTLSLLWQLVSTFGLDHLVDWRELCDDILRHGGRPGITVLYNEAVKTDEGCGLLQSWASAHAVKAGFSPVRNMTTAFTDGTIYAAILGNFAAYIPNAKKPVAAFNPNTRREHIRDQLAVLGCSKAFINQLAGAIGTFPSRETTISNLGFLASRLVPLAQKHYAAVKIQRTFRKKLERDAIPRRIKLVRVAYACAEVVRLRDSLLQQQEEESQRFVPFQAVARGFLARKTGGTRVMGGW